MNWEIREGDSLAVLRQLESESVQCVVTSPPYWGLRDYGIAPSVWPVQRSQAVVRCSNGDHLWEDESVATEVGKGNWSQGTNGRGERQLGGVEVKREPIRSTAIVGFCKLCGAWRGCLGLEPTPVMFVEHMVSVFREVRRVLRSDGTCWVNMGDSYASGGRQSYDANAMRRSGDDEIHPLSGKERPDTPSGMKPKDLCGIPWMLARALRDPYYTGKIKRMEDRIWLAAMIDAEGCMFIHKRKSGQNNGQGYQRQNDNYAPGLEVANTNEAIVRRCMQITGLGSICSQSPKQNDRRKQTIYRWNLRTTECKDVIREVYPYFVAKHQQARILCGCPSSGEKAEAAHAALIGLHNGLATDVDFPAPASMYQPGWYLRSDIVWSKCNPMPESVTDRPTKSHEYIFLLTKSERYFYDSEAIKEAATDTGRENGRDGREEEPAARPPGSSARTLARLDYSQFGRNKRTVWTVATQPFPEAHFATFPEELIVPCILAGTSEKGCCADCGAPWKRIVESVTRNESGSGRAAAKQEDGQGRVPSGWHQSESLRHPPRDQRYAEGKMAGGTQVREDHDIRNGPTCETRTVGWLPSCDCQKANPCVPFKPCVVLDPFAGSGTTGVVALRYHRDFIGIELSSEYAAMARKRITGDAPLFNTP